MRNLGLVFSFVVTLSLVAAALSYVPGYVGQQRIDVQGRHLGNPERDTTQTPPGDPDPYYQRYYSESEGWTYYARPPAVRAPAGNPTPWRTGELARRGR